MGEKVRHLLSSRINCFMQFSGFSLAQRTWLPWPKAVLMLVHREPHRHANDSRMRIGYYF
jgi:hypothetical protein